MKRREVLAAGGALVGVIPMFGCAAAEQTGSIVPNGIGLVDVHCHLFNSSDLPTVRFIKIAVLDHYPKQAVRTLDIDDPDAMDGLIALFTWIVGRTRAPSADDEIKVLDGQRALAIHANDSANDNAIIDAIATFAASSGVSAAGESNTAGINKVRKALLLSAGESSVAAADVPLSPAGAKSVAERAFRSKFDLGLLLRWFGLFTRYRYSLADKLAADHARQNFKPLLLCPAIVDYDNWLGEHVERSPLPKQIEVMGRLARRPIGPAVHGYVGFDPLRQVLFDERIRKDYEPLKVVAAAVRNEGFLGVKVYPPMGFKAIDNLADRCQTYPDTATFKKLLAQQLDDAVTQGCSPRPADGSRAISRKLDAAMGRLFDFCASENASVLAHANESNGAAKNYAQRADPAFWLPVFAKWPTLHVCLGHFGHFASRSTAAPAGESLPEASWEWTLGAYFKTNPLSPVFADISYLTEVFEKSSEDLVAYTSTMRKWIAAFDPECHHLMFGTDWTMLGLDGAYGGFSGGIYQYFRMEVGLDTVRMQRLFAGNAARFLSLREGDPGRKRIEAFYAKHGLPATRLPSLEG